MDNTKTLHSRPAKIVLLLTTVLCACFAILLGSANQAYADTITFDVSNGAVVVEVDAGGETATVTQEHGAPQTFTIARDTLILTGSFSTSDSTGVIIDGKGIVHDPLDITFDALSIGNTTGEKSCAFALTGGARVDVTLEGNSTLQSGKSRAGLEVSENSHLTITEDSTGSLEACSNGTGAGIGGDAYDRSNSTITINGGTIAAYSNKSDIGHGAGIGGGYNSDFSAIAITINGGIVNACSSGGSGQGSGAGIGLGGMSGSTSIVTITGGTVFACSTKGGKGFGTGIGSGTQAQSRASTTVTISGGTVTAYSSEHGTAYSPGIGTSNNDHGSTALTEITGGSVNARKAAIDTSPSLDPAPTSDGSSHVYLVTVTLENAAIPASSPVANTKLRSGWAFLSDGNYGIDDVVTDNDGKCYFYLPVPAKGHHVAPILADANNIYGCSTSNGSASDNLAIVADNTNTAAFMLMPNAYTVTYRANGSDVKDVPAYQIKQGGSPLALNAIAPTRLGYVFTGWDTNSTGGGSVYQPGDTYAGDAALILYAQWHELQSYQLDASASTGGHIDGVESKPYLETTQLTAAAVPDIGYDFTGWEAIGMTIPNPNENPFTFTMPTNDATLKATFAKQTFDISATAESNGSIAPEGNSPVLFGENITYTIAPDKGYVIKDVLVDGVSVGPGAAYTFENVTTHHTIVASFEKAPLIERTLTDTDHGITVQGRMAQDTTLNVEAGLESLHPVDTCKTCDEMRTQFEKGVLSRLFDISLDGEYASPLTITFHVGDEYDGYKATIYHCKDGKLETFETEVSDGTATVEVDVLSPFGIGLSHAKDPLVPNNPEVLSGTSTPKNLPGSSTPKNLPGPNNPKVLPTTGDTLPLAALPPAALLIAGSLSAVLACIAFVKRRNSTKG